MQIKHLHSWDVTPTEAVALQRKLADRVDAGTPLTSAKLIAGADVSFNRYSNVIFATVVVLSRDGEIVEIQNAVHKTDFPYVPGLLSFREAPALLEAFAQVETVPDVVVLDGHGVAHPRRIGIAAHVGLFLDVPTIGCAKTKLCGEHKEPGVKAGSMRMLKHKGEIIGKVVRTKNNVAPVYVSCGHSINLASAVRVTLKMCRGYRLPAPTRLAHVKVNEFRRATMK